MLPSTNDNNGTLEDTSGLVESPEAPALEQLLEYPREALERPLYERPGYWAQLVSDQDRLAMLDYIRQVAFSLAWQLYAEETESLVPDELRQPISLKVLLEYCAGTFKRLSQAIRLIAQSPNQRLIREQEFVEFSRARGKSDQALQWLVAHPKIERFEAVPPGSKIAPALAAIFTLAAPSGHRASYLPREILEYRVLVDFNTYENRFLRFFLSTMHRDLDTIAVLAQLQEEEEVRLQAEVLKREVRILQQYNFLQQSSTFRFKQKSSVVFQKQPYYRRAYEIYRFYRRVFAFDWANPLFQMPPQQMWVLYEYWCLFQVIDALSTLGFKAVRGATDFFFQDVEEKLILDLPKGLGRQLLLRRPGDGAEVTLYYGQEFADERFRAAGRGPLQHSLSPAILLAAPPGGVVFDVRFKSYAAEGSWYDDANKLHAYRDALSLEGKAIREAWCLYPGQQGEGQPRPGLPPAAEAGEGGVGLLRLRPGDESSFQNLSQLLGQWFPAGGRLAAPASPKEVEDLAGTPAAAAPPAPQREPFRRPARERGERQAQFERRARRILSQRWGVSLKRGKVRVGGVVRGFNMVSRGGKRFVGEAKQLPEDSHSSAEKRAAIAESVWLLQNLEGVAHRFVVFGHAANNKDAATRWLQGYHSLTQGLEFYFLNTEGQVSQWREVDNQGEWI